MATQGGLWVYLNEPEVMMRHEELGPTLSKRVRTIAVDKTGRGRVCHNCHLAVMCNSMHFHGSYLSASLAERTSSEAALLVDSKILSEQRYSLRALGVRTGTRRLVVHNVNEAVSHMRRVIQFR